MARAKGTRRRSATEKAGARHLGEYAAKRDFSVTPEPPPEPAPVPRATTAPTFMVHKHHATRLHYDLRLEMDGALASWAVPKGPSYDPDVKRLAVQTEDHPLEYGSFEGRIPDGEYGAGDSLIWDRGSYDTIPPGQASAQRKKGHLHLVFAGEKLQGAWHLVRTRGPAGTKSNWILFKARDELADKTRDIVSEAPGSVVSERAVTRGPERRSAVAHTAPEGLLKRVWPPMLATLVSAPPEPESEWVYELKYDGFRAVCAISGGRVAMWTRNALDLTARFPHIARALAKLVVGEAVIDGELAALDAKGVPRFQLLQEGSEDVRLFAFDLLWLDGQDLRARPLEERRDLLLSVMARVPPELRVAERVPGSPAAALAEVAARGGEGLIGKRRGSPYVGGRSKEWIKRKALKGQELAIVGFTRSSASDRQIGALLVGVVENGALRFAGKVGTGFTVAQRAELLTRLARDAVAEPRVAGAPRMRDATWVEPKLVAQVAFGEWTHDGRLRHPSFLGLRDDKSPMECVIEEAAAPPRKPREKVKKKREAKAAESESATELVPLTNPQKVLYPRDGITKQELADYFEAVSQPMLRALADRPLALQHWPDGIDKATFFRQDLGRDAPAWLTRVTTPTSTKAGSVAHLVADRPAALRWLAQRATLTVHMFSSRAHTLDQPDWVVFDLDPGEGHDIKQAIAVAQALHRLFDELSIPSLAKTTGKRGLHVLVPLLPGHTHQDAIEFAVRIGGALAGALPEVTMERAIAKRKGRLYLDCYQNGYGKTIVAPYSPRASDGAPVSAPLKWSEVDESLDPRALTVRTMPARVSRLGDLFAPALESGIRLPRLR